MPVNKEDISRIVDEGIRDLSMYTKSGDVHEANKVRGMVSQTLTEYKEILGEEYHHYTGIISNIEIERGYNQDE